MGRRREKGEGCNLCRANLLVGSDCIFIFLIWILRKREKEEDTCLPKLMLYVCRLRLFLYKCMSKNMHCANCRFVVFFSNHKYL